MQCIVNGLIVTYEDAGHGGVILMLHGWKDDLNTFNNVALHLSKSFRVIRIDLPGFGKSEIPHADWTLDDYVAFVRDFCAKLDVQPDVLVGHSFGGRITIKGVAGKVLNARKIVLISSAGVARRKTLKNYVLAVLAKIGRVITAIPPISFWKNEIRKKLYENMGSDYLHAEALRGTFLNIIKEDLSAVAPYISVPSLIIWGGADDTTPIEEGRLLNRLIPGSLFKVIEGAGHFVHAEKPLEVSSMVREFLV
jgi:pimeloyl-ACP methyl ester carboxylesterase